MSYIRDFLGYGETPQSELWPGEKTLALSIVVNYEEGGEHSLATDGIVESIGEFGPVDTQARDVGMESVYEYAQRVGIWRILKLFREKKIKATFYAVAKALDLNRDAAKAIIRDGHEICDHGYSWTELYKLTYEEERAEIKNSIKKIEEIVGKKPVGFYAREPSEHTLDIIQEFDNFIYDSDSYADDIPYYYNGGRMLILPYTPDANDFHFQNPMNRFSTGNEFFTYLKDTFDTLYDESFTTPKLMSAAFHVRVSGRPGRIGAMRRFIDYVLEKEKVWIATREEIAKYWIKKYNK